MGKELDTFLSLQTDNRVLIEYGLLHYPRSLDLTVFLALDSGVSL